MLSVAELVIVIEKVTYKPGWDLIVREPDSVQGPYLSVLVELENSYRPGETVPLRIHSPIPPCPDEDAFLGWVAWRLGRIELHEVLEWFKVSGSPWIDPHRGLD